MAHGTMKATMYLFFLVLTTSFLIANSARNRILDEVDPQQPQVIGNLPLPGAANPSVTKTAPVITTPQVGPTTALPTTQTSPDTGDEEEAEAPSVTTTTAPGTTTTLPSNQTPADTGDEEEAEAESPFPVPVPATTVTAPVDDVSPVPVPVPIPATTATAPVDDVSPVATTAKEPSLSFFMHDIIGGSHPSARVVAGIIANTDVTGLPFSQANNNLFPITGGIPLVNPKLNGIVTNNNLPLLVGLSGSQASTVFENPTTGNIVSGANNQPFVSAGNLPAGFTLQKLMFGSITVVDDQLTEGHELGSAVIGRAQGFYMASSLDGTSQSIVLTVLLHGGEHNNHDVLEDSISLFGVHRTASTHSEVAVIGGTGKYENARGYAVLETLLKQDQHITDGIDTILHFEVYLTHY